MQHRVHRPLASDHGGQHPEDGKKQQHLISVQQYFLHPLHCIFHPCEKADSIVTSYTFSGVH